MLRNSVAILILVLGASVLPTSAAAQISRADSAAVLLQAARTFDLEGREGVATALLEYISERFGDTAAGQEAMELLRAAPEERSERASQVELMVWSTLYGTWLGVAIPAAFGADDTAPYGLGLLVGAPGGLLAGRAAGKARSMSEGQVRAITLGGTWGTWQGYGWAEVFDLGADETCYGDICYVDDPDGETLMKAMILGGVTGIATGAILSRSPIPAGVATSANFGALWGTWFGVAGGILADVEGDALLGTTLMAGNGGLLGGALLGSAWEISRPRARLISIAGVLGGLVGGGLDLLIQPDDEKVAIGIPLATSIAGLWAGAALTADERSFGGRALEGNGPDLLDPALIHFGEGGFRPGIPAPFATVLPVETPRGAGWRPGIGVNIFSARF